MFILFMYFVMTDGTNVVCVVNPAHYVGYDVGSINRVSEWRQRKVTIHIHKIEIILNEK